MQKLHLGCGPNVLSGWINIDIDSPVADAVLDLTQGLPYADGSVSHIFAEHIIEHIEFEQAVRLVSECRRVLIPGGAVRFSTPDLAWLVVVYLSGLTTEWSELWQPQSPCMLINEGMRAWGHRFLYDRGQFYQLFRQSGFNDLIDCEWRESADAQLRNLESRPFHHDLIVEARYNPAIVEWPAAAVPNSKKYEVVGVPALLLEQAKQLEKLDVIVAEYELAARVSAQESSRQTTIIQSLQQHVSDLGVHFTGFEACMRDREVHINGLESGIVDRDRHIKGLEDGIKDRDVHITGLENALGVHTTFAADLKADNDARCLQISSQSAWIKELETQVSDCGRQIGDLESLLAGLRDSLIGRIALRLSRK